MKREMIFGVVGVVLGLVVATVGWMFVGVSGFEEELVVMPSTTTIGMAEVDLNGDGMVDRVTLTKVHDGDASSQSFHLLLMVNDSTVDVPGYNPVGFIDIVDLDRSDSQYELAFSDMGPSSDYTTSYVAYDGTSLRLLGTIEGLSDQTEFPGDGTLTTISRAHILDTWFYRDTFKLVDGDLVRLKKEFYERLTPNEPMKVLDRLSLQTSPTNAAVATTLQAGDRVTITGCDDVAWCQVKTTTGRMGWFSVENFNQIRGTGESAEAYFEGLSNAD